MAGVISEEGTASLEGAQKWGTLARRGRRKLLPGEEQRVRRWKGKTSFSSCYLAKARACFCRPPGEEVILVSGRLGVLPLTGAHLFQPPWPSCHEGFTSCPPTDSLLVVNPRRVFRSAETGLAGLRLRLFEPGGWSLIPKLLPSSPDGTGWNWSNQCSWVYRVILVWTECGSRVAQTDLFLTLPSPSVWGQSRKSWGWWGSKIPWEEISLSQVNNHGMSLAPEVPAAGGQPSLRLLCPCYSCLMFLIFIFIYLFGGPGSSLWHPGSLAAAWTR